LRNPKIKKAISSIILVRISVSSFII
jgi:hypothetical protein